MSQTYETKRHGFVFNPTHRKGSLLNKDSKLSNLLIDAYDTPDKENARVFVKSRPGLSLAYTTAAGVGRGLYYWVVNGVGYIITVSGSGLYSNGTFLMSLTTSTGPVGFTEHVSSVGAVSLVLVDGVKGYVFSSPTVAPTLISSANFPSPHIPTPIFLDGYIFLAGANSQNIYNSDIDVPANWTVGNYISAEMYPDKLVALSKNNNYIYAVGSGTVEYMSDIAGTTTPLGRSNSAVQQFGAINFASVVQTDDEVILVGETGNGGHTVWTINGYTPKEIGTPTIRSILRNEGNNLVNCVAYCIRVAGQKLYILNLTSITLVYSFDAQMWTEWTSSATGTTAFVGIFGDDGPNGMAYVLDSANGNVYLISEEFTTDNGTAFLCQIVTPKYDYDSMDRKFMYRFMLRGDPPDVDGSANNNLTLEWSDDDYTTWQGNRTISFNSDFPALFQLGVFRRRAFRISYGQPKLLRLEGFEVDINKGGR